MRAKTAVVISEMQTDRWRPLLQMKPRATSILFPGFACLYASRRRPPGYLGPPRAKSMGRKRPRNPPREGMPLTHQRDRSMGRTGPRIRPRDDDVGGHPAESPPGSRQRMSGHAVGWFIHNKKRAFANMDDGQLNHVSETLNHEMD